MNLQRPKSVTSFIPVRTEVADSLDEWSSLSSYKALQFQGNEADGPQCYVGLCIFLEREYSPLVMGTGLPFLCVHVQKTMGRWACMLGHCSRVLLFVTLCTVAGQALPAMEFSRQEYWSQQPCPTPGYLSNPGIKPRSPESPALAGGFFTTSANLKWVLSSEMRH